MTLIEVVRKIVNEHGFMYVKQCNNGLYTVSTEDKNGFTMLDVTTANAIKTVFENISENRQEKLNALPLLQAVNICWKCLR